MIFAAFFRVQAASTTLYEFQFQFRENFLWIEVTVPQSNEPLNFLVDTGAGMSVINLSTAKRIGLKLGREVMVHGVQTRLAGYWEQHVTAKAGNVRLPDEYLAVDLGLLSGSCERPVDGLLGADFFRRRVVQIDFDAQKIRLLKPMKSYHRDKGLSLELWSGGMRAPITVNNKNRQWVRLDTGCATALQSVTVEVPSECTSQVAIGLTEISIPQTKTTVRLGEHEFESVPTGLHKEAIFPGEAGLLGNGLLSRFSAITIDGKAGRLFLQGRRRAQ